MGDPFLLPTIAAVVLGGTNVLGGRGTYLGTVAGVILITLLQSILSVVQPQHLLADLGLVMLAEAIRQIVFGVAIIAMLLLYGRVRARTPRALTRRKRLILCGIVIIGMPACGSMGRGG